MPILSCPDLPNADQAGPRAFVNLENRLFVVHHHRVQEVQVGCFDHYLVAPTV
jgi:hypothetical protein